MGNGYNLWYLCPDFLQRLAMYPDSTANPGRLSRCLLRYQMNSTVRAARTSVTGGAYHTLHRCSYQIIITIKSSVLTILITYKHTSDSRCARNISVFGTVCPANPSSGSAGASWVLPDVHARQFHRSLTHNVRPFCSLPMSKAHSTQC